MLGRFSQESQEDVHRCLVPVQHIIARNKCIASSNKCLTSSNKDAIRNKKLLGTKGIATRNKIFLHRLSFKHRERARSETSSCPVPGGASDWQ